MPVGAFTGTLLLTWGAGHTSPVACDPAAESHLWVCFLDHSCWLPPLAKIFRKQTLRSAGMAYFVCNAFGNNTWAQRGLDRGAELQGAFSRGCSQPCGNVLELSGPSVAPDRWRVWPLYLHAGHHWMQLPRERLGCEPSAATVPAARGTNASVLKGHPRARCSECCECCPDSRVLLFQCTFFMLLTS